ncbi:DUF4386 family protein [Asticcacaulis sp. AC402]|uniref:DUF4386 family protein n=1 Tax=Asticcacaulis sp. AC402 TaxID=1282361 RepID=UPI0003C3E0D8|nr:DUF4386 family protein [Asticcacaulis sp. AC402]ESQ73582.1 hypothetical protein ABAC402_18640 [Asticcacaulis sp. AC402]
MTISSKVTGAGAIALAVVFNLPYGYLAQNFHYPDILRRPSAEVLAAFAAGGDGLVWAWYVFGLSALAFVPLAIAMALTTDRIRNSPAVAIGAALAGVLAGLVQAMGLFRWVFVVPGLAQQQDLIMAGAQFDLMNAFAGVAIGEHMGQIFTALFVGLIAMLQWSERARISSVIGGVTAGLMVVGAGGGLALALGQSDGLFAMLSIGAYLGLTVWLITTGIGMLGFGKARATRQAVYV